MFTRYLRIRDPRTLVIGIGLIVSMPTLPALAADDTAIQEIVVTSQRRDEARLDHVGNIGRLEAADIERVAAHHVHDLLHKAPGVWIVRGSGQDSQTSIRSPVLGGAGACGSFLVLEDGIPVRPANFCNSNYFAELITEQAGAVEVIRGPANATLGSGALHGAVNVLMPYPGDAAPRAALEYGANDYLRGRFTAGGGSSATWLATGVVAHDGGFRDDTGYDLYKLHAKRDISTAHRDITIAASATRLRQSSAGFIVGQNAYEDESLSSVNLDPDAFRNASSARAYALIRSETGSVQWDVRPYLRYSSMRFLHHAVPGQPIEKNGQASAGVMTSVQFGGDRHETLAVFDVEISNAFLEQSQTDPAVGPPAQVETRPVGRHYDYSVLGGVVAAALQSSVAINDRASVSAGLRLEYGYYDYDNRMLDGNTRDDGTPCGFGGCIYTRPADRVDQYFGAIPNVGATFRLRADMALFVNVSTGFRLPQTLELYRLQSGQTVADLDPEEITSAEFGIRMSRRAVSLELAGFAMSKRDSVFRDAAGFNVTGARSRHSGVELDLAWRPGERWAVDLNASYGRHKYDFDRAGRGETFVSGNDIDSAPRWLGSAELRFDPSSRISFGIQFNAVGGYYLEPGNRFRYGGHVVANARAGIRLNRNIDIVLRLNNVADERYADRADFGGGNYRYFPGRGREAFVELRYTGGGAGSS